MRSLLVLVSTLAVAACSPTFGLLGGHHGGGGLGGIIGGGGGGCHGGNGGVAIPLHGGGGGGVHDIKSVPGAIIGGILGGGFGGLGGLHGGRTDRGYKQKGGVYPIVGGGIFQALGFFAQGLTDIVGNAHSILRDVIELNPSGVIDDAFNGFISVGRAAGGIINAVIPGLGTLLGNFVVSIGKIFICILGSPGLSGSIIGHGPGKDNPRDIPYICNREYGRKYGYNYDGDYTNADDVILFYKVKNAKQQALKLINDYSHGRGINSLSGSQRIVCERIIIIANIFERDYKKWSRNDFKIMILNIMIIVSVLGDSYQHGLGPKIADEFIIFLKKNDKNAYFSDIFDSKEEIYNALKGCKVSDWNGAFNQKNQGTYVGSQSDNSNSGSDITNNSSSNDNSNNNSSNDNSNNNSNNEQNSSNNQAEGSSDNNQSDTNKSSIDTNSNNASGKDGSNGADGSGNDRNNGSSGSGGNSGSGRSNGYTRRATGSKSEKESSGATNNSQHSGSGSSIENADGSRASESNYQDSADATTNQAKETNNARNEEITSNNGKEEYSKVTADRNNAKTSSATQNSSNNSGGRKTSTNSDGTYSDESSFDKNASSGKQEGSDVSNSHGEEVNYRDKDTGRTYNEKVADSNSEKRSSDAENSSHSSGSQKETIRPDGSKVQTYNFNNSAESSSNQATEKKSSHAVEQNWSS